MKRIAMFMNQRDRQKRGRRAFLFGIASMVMLPLMLSLANAQSSGSGGGCPPPVDDPNPQAGLLSPTLGCVKFIHDPTPSNCKGPDSDDGKCVQTTVAGSWTIYTKPGSTPGDCDPDSNGWVQDGDTKHGDVAYAYQDYDQTPSCGSASGTGNN